MPRRRAVALAQALTLSLLLLPGLPAVGPATVEAARRPIEPEPSTIYDAAGKGIGCQTGGRTFKGPRLPSDPPWPPGAKPSPTPEPSPSAVPAEQPSPVVAPIEPSAAPSIEPSAAPSDEPAASAEPEPEAAVMAFTAAELETAQAEVGATPRPTDKLVTGIDVSWHKGEIDFERVREAGHRFVIIKATENNDFIDKNYAANLAAARAAGLITGAYHVFDYTLNGKAQADHFIDRLEAVGGLSGALPPVVDVECWSYYGPSIQAVSAARLRDLVARIYQRTGLLPTVYTSSRMWSEVVGNADGFEGLRLWTACWDCDRPPTTPDGWDDWSFWQVTNAWRVPGISGNVDGNYFRGSRRQLRSLRSRPFAIEGGTDASGGGTVELDLGGRVGTHFRTSPDGETWSEWRRLRGTPTAVIPETEGEHTVHLQLKNGPGLKSPIFRDAITVDGTPPELTAPTISLRTGLLGSGAADIPLTARWEARDLTAGLADAEVLVSCGDGQRQRTEASGHGEPGELVTWEAQTWAFPGAVCELTAIAADGVGNTAQQSVSGSIANVEPAADATATATLSGDQLGIVAERGPDRGRASVILDGEAVALIDLYAPEAAGPELVYVADLPEGEHRVAVEATGSRDERSSGLEVAIEGYVTLTR
ncbi:MAG: GH25 family lysozyme [Chloroflexota bacterium]|jgi:GH25 family lysozyme M1 (1,4-beta-N-acetylmuramidase)